MKSHIMLQAILCASLFSCFYISAANEDSLQKAITSLDQCIAHLKFPAEEIKKTNPELAQHFMDKLSKLRDKAENTIKKIRKNKESHVTYQKDGVEKMELHLYLIDKIPGFKYEKTITDNLMQQAKMGAEQWLNDLMSDNEVHTFLQEKHYDDIQDCHNEIQKVMEQMQEYTELQSIQKIMGLMDEVLNKE